jgi:hypothetical protein
MHPRIEELSRFLDAQRDALRAAIDGVPAHLRSVKPADGRWSVDGVIEHLVMIEGRVTGVLKTKLADARAAGVGRETEESPVLPTFALGGMLDRSVKLNAPEHVQPKGVFDSETGWDALQMSRQGLRALLAEADGLSCCDIVHPHPVFGPINLYAWFAFLGAHEARHASQIREVGAALAGA